MTVERSPVAAVTRSLEALKGWNDPAMFITLKDQASLIAEAQRLEEAGPEGRPLYGQVFAVKDNIDVAGLPTTAACPEFAYTPQRSAFVVERLEAAGALVIGKTNLDQFATGLVGVRSPYGIPRNVLRADLVPGGSSSGSATAVASGIVDFALGTDTAGSGRIPAGLNGIVGLKPSLGLLSSTGMLPACRTLDTISVFASTVEVALEVTKVAAAFDEADAYSRRFAPVAMAPLPSSLKIGVPQKTQRLFFGDTQSEQAFAVDLEKLSALGAEIIEVDFEPLHAVARLLYEGPWVAERYSATKSLLEKNPAAMLDVTRSIIQPGGSLTAVAAFEAYYRLADLKRKVEPLLASVDCLVVPTVPRYYTVDELAAEPVKFNSNLGSYTNFVNLLDMAGISCPVGRRADGLPSSITFLGKAGSDGALAAIAQAANLGQPLTGPGATPAGFIEIAVVGAHLTGLPLNHELTGPGGKFLRAVETVPDYRLFALPGTVPPKPGLLRVGTGEGSAIVAEIWALDPAAFGAFVARIPQPLGIGTLSFGDGSQVKGFLVEAVAVEGAEDISHFGGWRAYLASR